MKTDKDNEMTTNNQAKKPETTQVSSIDSAATAKEPDEQKHAVIHTRPGLTNDGKPFDHVVKKKVANGDYRLQTIPGHITGTSRPIEVYRATRAKNNIIKPWEPQTDDASYCPAHWSDIAIGRGACGFRCRACFLMLTHRVFCDPSRHVLYENTDDYVIAVQKELRKPGANLGLGIDCGDSLLYEGVTGLARRLIPLFADKKSNPFDRKLILLTKSTNIHYLEGLPTKNVLMTFSVNPEPIADLWEGKWNDGVRITPPIEDRLAASALAQEMNFEVRWRVDPILPFEGWREIYHEFFVSAAADGHRPSRITLGTYREMGRSLLTIAKKWGLPPMEWTPPKLSKDGMHYHMEGAERIEIYRHLNATIEASWPPLEHTPIVALCKESKQVRAAVDLNHDHCNCE